MDNMVKRQTEDLLKQRDFDSILAYCEQNRHVWKEVRFRLYDMDDSVRWAAIETAGRYMKRWWVEKREDKVRQYIRTLFWSITDESGGIGWSAPQAIAEIIANIPELIDPYGSMMIAYSIEEPPLAKGGLWGMGRLGRRIAASVDFFRDKILAVFHSNDVETLGLAAWAMGETVYEPARPFLEKLVARDEPVQIYRDGRFDEKPLGQWARNAIARLEGAE